MKVFFREFAILAITVATFFVVAVFVTGCASKIGTIPGLNSDIISSRLDMVHGVITDTHKDGTKTKKDVNLENYIDIDWKTGYVASTPMYFVWEPLAGPDYMATQGFSLFAGVRYLSISSFGLHFGADGKCLIPLGLNWRRGGMVFGVQLGIPYKELFDGKNPPVLPGGMATLAF